VLTGILVLSAASGGKETPDEELTRQPTLESGDLNAPPKEEADGASASLNAAHSPTPADAVGSGEASAADDRSAPLLDSSPRKNPSTPLARGTTSPKTAKEAVGEPVKEPVATSTNPAAPLGSPPATPKKTSGSIFNKSVGGNKERQRPTLDADNPFR
jgi:hypothetical protein